MEVIFIVVPITIVSICFVVSAAPLTAGSFDALEVFSCVPHPASMATHKMVAIMNEGIFHFPFIFTPPN